VRGRTRFPEVPPMATDQAGEAREVGTLLHGERQVLETAGRDPILFSSRLLVIRLLILSLALVSPGVVAQTAAETPRTIRVVMDNAYAPFAFQSAEGRPQGTLI